MESLGAMRAQCKTNLIVQHKEQGTTHTQVPWPLHLEPICLLGCRCPVPLHRRKSEVTHRPSWIGGA